MEWGLVRNWIGTPLTPERLNGIKKVLTDHGVSDVGAGQIIRSEMVANASDRQKLLELLNMVVTVYTPKHGRGGKG